MAQASVRVSGVTGLIANIYAADREVTRAVQRATKRAADDVEALAKQLAPVDTGRLKRSITKRVSPGGLTFEVFPDPAVFAGDNVQDYSPFVEFGTIHSPAQPFLFPAMEAIAPHYRRDVSDAVRRALRRAAKS